MIDLGGVFRKDAEIEQFAVARADAVAVGLLEELFPDTTEELVSAWERVYAITPQSGSTIVDRRKVLVAHVRATGGLNRAYYENIAEGLGYTIGAPGDPDPHLRFVEGSYAPFRADYGRADIDAVWDPGGGISQYTVRVAGTGVSSDVDLQRALQVSPPVAGVVFEYVDE